jgi:hypothetical protein
MRVALNVQVGLSVCQVEQPVDRSIDQSNNNKNTKLSQLVIFQQTGNPIGFQCAVLWKVANCYSVERGAVVGEPTVHHHFL